MGWQRLVGFLKLQVSFAKKPYKRDLDSSKRPIILRSLLLVATPWYTSLRLDSFSCMCVGMSVRGCATLPGTEAVDVFVCGSVGLRVCPYVCARSEERREPPLSPSFQCPTCNTPLRLLHALPFLRFLLLLLFQSARRHHRHLLCYLVRLHLHARQYLHSDMKYDREML